MTLVGQNRRSDWWWALFALALYAYPFPYFAILRSPNELSRVYQVRALVDDHAISVNGSVQRYGPVGDLSEFHGRMYPNKAPGISFVGAVVYAVARALAGGAAHLSNRTLTYLLRLFCCALPTALLLIPLHRYVVRISGDRKAADAAILVYAFGSLAMTYSLLFFSHQLDAVLLAASFLALEQGKRSRSLAWPFLGGLTAAYAVVTEYPSAPIALALGIYALLTGPRRIPAGVAFALGALPCAILLGAYHQTAYGSPFSTGYAHVQNQVFASWHAQGFMGVTLPRPQSLLGNLFAPSRGLFAFAPAFLFAMPGLWLLFRRNLSDGLLALVVTVFYFFLAAAFLYEAWGWMVGPRHLTPLMPFLAAPLACAIAWLRARSSRWTGVAAGLCASSILVTGATTAVYPHIPEEFTGAVAHLIWPLLQSGHLPYNLMELRTGYISNLTWLPWFVLLSLSAVGAAALCLTPLRGMAIRLVAAAALTGHLALLFAVPGMSPQEKQTLAWIEQNWEPASPRSAPVRPVRPSIILNH